MSILQKFMRPSSRSQRTRNLLAMIAMQLCLVLGVFTLTSRPAYAANTLSVDEVMLLYAYIGSSNQISIPSENALATVSHATVAGDWKLDSGTASIDQNGNMKVNGTGNLFSADDIWKTVTTLYEAYGHTQKGENGRIETLQYPTCFKQAMTAVRIYNLCGGNQAAFTPIISNLAANAGGTITLTLATGKYAAGQSLYDSKLNTAVTNTNADWVQRAASETFDKLYDMSEFDPNAGVADGFLSSVYKVINVIFYLGSNFIIGGFFVQTVLDAAYILYEPIRPFIGPKSASGGGLGVNNGAGRFSLSSLHIPICSEAAAEVTGASSGGIGGGAAAASMQTAFLRYLWKRAPLLISIAIIFILTVLGYWRLVISWVASFVIKGINAIMQLGG